MNDRHLPAFGLTGLTLLTLAYFLISVPQEAARKDALTFTNTATWEPNHLAVAKKQTRYPQELFASISLPPPPKNSSPETAKELSALHTYQNQRTPREVQDIVTEVRTKETYFAGHSIKEYMDRTQFPATAALLADSIHDLEVIEMQQKEKFDRIRPSFLDTTLTPVIVVPEFPAYPSYHATETHFFAYVFAELAPSRRDEFLARAQQIALNREIAGVHYPSDSAAGVLLAQQFFDIMMKNEKFETLLAAAKAEWAMHPELSQARATP